ncbi:hypothetical protein Daesc_000235 [Daldinia eschscholtzii]|uniref:F-box domain-containing protein n=1 Tax=Daldinia eschscholtzii TaxID=292717 RepID=A0AAX6MXR1_9PEZI
MALLRLPNELLTLISNHLEIKDISRTCRSCRTLYHALDHILYRLIVNKSEVLFHAVEQGLAPVVEKLLIAGASPDQAMFTYPLYGAVESNSALQDYQLQLTLLEQQNRGIQRNGPRSSQDGLSGQPPSQFWTPLHLAAGLGDNYTVKLLLDHGANINALSHGFCRCEGTPKPRPGPYPELPPMNTAELPWWTPLHTAICHKKYSTAQILVTRGASFQVASRALGSSSNYVTALHSSSCENALDFSKFILEYYQPPINIEDHRGMGPLHWAYKAGHWDMAKWLVLNGADINAHDTNGCTLLLDACAAGRFEEALELIGLGANPSSGFNTTPLHCCCDFIVSPRYRDPPEAVRLAVVKRLVEAGADVNAKNRDDGDTALAVAAERGLVSTVEYLLDAGADLHARGSKGMTPLIRACMCGGQERYQHATVKLLLQRGASTTDVDNEGRNAMEIVCSSENGHPDKFAIIKLLLEYRSPHDASSSPTKSLIFPLFMSHRAEICEYLMKFNTRHPSKKELGSMIFEAIEERNPAYLQFALQFKDAVKVLATKKRLFHALEAGNFKVAHIILEAGAPWEHVSRSRWTSLHHACRGKNTMVVRMLLERGADPNQSTVTGDTPLDLALSQGDLAMFELLLDHGADPFPALVDKSIGKPHIGALLQAVRSKNPSIVEVIMKRDLFRSAPAVEQIRTMYYACNQDSTHECLEALLRGGVDPNMPLLRPCTLDYCLPLQIAKAKKNREAVQLLLKYGATPLE